MAEYLIDFEPVGRRGSCPSSQSLLDSARQLGVELVAICGGDGTCGRCKVQVLEGTVSTPTAGERDTLSPEELGAGFRLACEAYALSDCKLCVPPASLSAPQRTQVEGLELDVPPEPVVRTYEVSLAPPSLSDLQEDAGRLLAALAQQDPVAARMVDFAVLQALSPRLRDWDWRAQAIVRDGEVIAVTKVGTRPLGLAVDLGTTKIAGYLLDLESGRTLAARGIMNPQISYGEDVVARMARTRDGPEEAERLQSLVVEALNELVRDLCAEAEVPPEAVVEAVLVGNTAMHHLLLRLPVEQLAMAPYVPAVQGALDVKARDVGLHLAGGAYVHLLPNVAGFVGADHIAMLLATGAWQAEGVVLALDIGTNTEVCLVSGGTMTSVSCASGPAFEGAHVQHGMRAAPGAIEHLRLVDDQAGPDQDGHLEGDHLRVEYQTVGSKPPVGLCGSGILDALAQLCEVGVVDRRGRMGDHPRVSNRDGVREFVLVPEEGGYKAIAITQRDVRELQLAKGAIRAGINVLLAHQGLSEGEIDEVVIAGAFGTYIDVDSAVAIGMLPALPPGRFRQVGNAAGMGAKLALISRSQRAQAQAIARRVGYLELASDPGFTRTLMEASYLG